MTEFGGKVDNMTIAVLQRFNGKEVNDRVKASIKTKLYKWRDVRNIINECEDFHIAGKWLAFNVVLLITGLITNVILLWLFLRERKSLSASKVLGVNIVVLNLLYLLMYPVFLYSDILFFISSRNTTVDDGSLQPVELAMDTIYSFHLVGCPLLLTCMCVERYLAVAKPVLYLRLSRRDYNVAISVVMWVITLGFCVLTAVQKGLKELLLPLAVIISCLFLLMIASLGGVAWALWQPSPTHTTHSNSALSSSQAPPPSSLKRKAVKNVLAVMVPAVVSYLPILGLVPFISYLETSQVILNPELCNIFNCILLFPNTGVLIGPTFYLAKARQILCRRGVDKG